MPTIIILNITINIFPPCIVPIVYNSLYRSYLKFALPPKPQYTKQGWYVICRYSTSGGVFEVFLHTLFIIVPPNFQV